MAVNKTKFLVLAIYITWGITLGADIRESVVIVKPNLSNEGIEVYRSIAGVFRKQNLTVLSDYFDPMTQGGFGSGFLAIDSYGRSVVVTNRHVVAFAESATITLTWKDGGEASISLENCRILYEDPDIDFALVLLPEGAFNGTPRLELAESTPADGDTVWAAGYPGLSGIPSWRLTEGAVTNQRVVVESLGPAQFAVFTEHSASIDPGNSGGPLLLGDASDPSSFRVVGMNTWVGLDGQGSNLAVSLEMLREAFARIPDPSVTTGATEVVRVKVENFISHIESPEWQRFESSRYISSRMVVKQGWMTFNSVLSIGSETERKTWAERFLRESPVEALRQAISYKIYSTLHKEGRALTLMYINEMSGAPGERRVRIGLAAGKNVYFFEWQEERGSWSIADSAIPTGASTNQKARTNVDTPAPEKKPEGGYLFPAGLTVGFGVSSIPTIYGWRAALNQSIGYQFGFGRIASAGASLVVDAGAALVEYGSQAMPLIVGLKAEGRIGIPLELNDMTMFPFAQFGAKAGVSTTGSGDDPIRFSVEADLGLFLRLSSRWSVGFELGASFATDAGLRLEGIPIRLLFIF